MAPWFSIILPIYRVEDYLLRCVQSVLMQGFTDYEIILVDDGSPDGCPAMCRRLAEENPCIQVLHKENGGLSSARNAGLEIARGQYIWWVDSDDWIEPDSLQKLYEATADALPDMVKINHFRVTGETSVPICSNATPGEYQGELCRQLLQKACYTAGKFVLSAWSHIYRREFLQNNGLQFVSERIVGSEDYLFNLESYLLAEKIVVLADVLYDYDLRQGSLSQTYKKDLPRRYAQLYRLLLEQYEKAGARWQYQGALASFYLWHLLHGTCIPNEYYGAGHTLTERRANIRAFLSDATVAQAYACCDKSRFDGKKRIQLWAMKMRWEPLFYWLYVKKPGRKKG